MLLEKLQALIGAVPAGSEDIAYAIAGLILLYMIDCFCSLLKITFRGVK